MHIFHIPSWFPCRHGEHSGISCENLIKCLSIVHPETHNTVSLYKETTYWWVFHYPSPIKEVFGYFKASNKSIIIKQSANLDYIYSPKSLVYSTRLGFNERRSAYKMHRENLILCIKNNGKPDVIHAQVTNTGGYVAWLLSKEFDIPYIITERFAPFPMPDYLKEGKLIDEIYKPLNEANRVISVSPAFAKIIEEYTHRKVESIPNFLDEDFFKPKEVDTTSENANRKFRFATLALTYEPRKGIDTLIKAIKILRDKGFAAVFRIGGGRQDEYYSKVNELAVSLNVQDSIEWFGAVDRKGVVELMQNSDCFVLASTSESFGTVYIEAIACGKPIIATKCGGPESIVNDINGLLVSIGNPEELAEALMHMITNCRNYSSLAIRNDFLERFSKNVVVRRYFDIYYNIIKANNNKCVV